MSITCPKCRFTQAEGAACGRCGVIIAKAQARTEPPPESPAPNATRDDDLIRGHALTHFLMSSRRLRVDQHARHWGEILVGWEQRNEYDISGDSAGFLGSMVEQGTGPADVVARLFLGMRRPLGVTVFAGAEHRVILEIERPFYWLNSTLIVRTGADEVLGRVTSRIGLLHRLYDLGDEAGVFASIRSARWRPWTFPIVDGSGVEQAVIKKKWGGFDKEYYTDADDFGVDFGTCAWTQAQRAVIVAAAVSIDYDYFENNAGRNR